jgi:glucokinase
LKTFNVKMIIAVDFGGTKIRTAVVDETGSLVCPFLDVPTEADRERERIQRNLFSAIDGVVARAGVKIADIQAIGIGSPGPLDLNTGTILNAPNLPSLNGYALKKQVEAHYAIPVYVENDANCFVLGESVFGVAKGKPIVTGLTLGTGMGCGIVINGKVYHGATGTAAEIWSTPYEGGIFEDYVSGRGLTAMYQKRTGQDIDARAITDRAASGEAAAVKTMDAFGMHLGHVLTFMVNLLDPDIVVIGGSISKAYPYFEKSMEHFLNENIHPLPRDHVEIAVSRFDDIGGLLGAAALCL